MNTEQHAASSNGPTQQRKGGFMQGLPDMTAATNQGLGVASTCCGEPAVSTGGGCCGEPAASSTTAAEVTSGGCCGEPTLRSADGSASGANGSGCCN